MTFKGVFFLAFSVWAAPVSNVNEQLLPVLNNRTALQQEIAPSWMTMVNARGTSELLWSCLVTLTLCVYTAIHLNVPPAAEGRVAFYSRKAKWVLIAIVAPEIVVYTAFQQWYRAKKTVHELNSLKRSSRSHTDAKHAPSRSNFDLTYGFYIIMGGFVADVRHLHEGVTRATITAPGMIALARHGHFADISNNSINDRSKADILGKALVVVQVCWLLVNCIGRKILGYPLALLEIHTTVHVICALLMYSFWFKKPLDIRDPTPLDIRDMEGPIALLLMGSPGFLPWRAGDSPPNLSEADILRFFTPGNLEKHPVYDMSAFTHTQYYNFPSGTVKEIRLLSPRYRDVLSTSLVLPHDDEETRRWKPVSSHGRLVLQGLNSGEYLDSKIGPSYHYHGAYIEDNRYPRNGQEVRYKQQIKEQLQLSQTDLKRWAAVAALRQERGKNNVAGPVRDVLDLEESVDYMALGIPNLVSISSSATDGPLSALRAAVSETQKYPGLEGFMLFLLPLIYGGVHLTAWHYKFATGIERVLWVAACFDLMAQSVLVWPGFASSYFADTGLSFICNFLSLFNMPLYVAARLYLVVESFASLRRVPMGVYVTVPWANYIPHI